MPLLHRRSGRLVLGALIVGGAAAVLLWRLRPSPAVEAYARGQSLAAAHRTADARAAYEEALRRDPGFALPYRALAEMADAERDREAAVRYWKGYAARSKRGEHALCRLAAAEMRAGLYVSALRDAEQELKRDADCARAHLVAGLMYERKSAAKASVDHLMQAARAYPHHPSVQLAYGRVLALSGDYQRAEPILRGAAEREPARAEIFRWLGYVRARLSSNPEKLRQAEQSLRRAVALRPHYPEANYELARLYFQMRQPRKALPFAQKAIAKRRHYPRALSLLAQVHAATGNPTEAARYRQAFRREMDLAARQQRLLKRYSQDPNDLGTILEMGEVLLARDEPETAVRYLVTAARRAPDDARVRAALEEATERLSRKKGEAALP